MFPTNCTPLPMQHNIRVRVGHGVSWSLNTTFDLCPGAQGVGQFCDLFIYSVARKNYINNMHRRPNIGYKLAPMVT